ncbi:MAG: prepilin-type N-terminal cleavage/methylation domain-containing protein [Firmicutes bacterium]|nr:prepilin-type N-terminal cleavage/methylation domain-containing protein [Bacillota bacterium]
MLSKEKIVGCVPRTSHRVCSSKNKGLTLIEVLVAFVVLGITATLFYQAFASAAWSGAGSKWREEALNQARKQVEYLMSKDFYAPELANGSITIPVTTGDLAAMNGKIIYTIQTAPNTQDKKITVKVTWDEPGEQP